MRRARSRPESWASCSMRPAGSCSSMPSITGGLNGAPAGRFLDVSGWVGVLFPPPQAEFREFLLKPSLFVMRRSEDRPEFDWPCRT